MNRPGRHQLGWWLCERGRQSLRDRHKMQPIRSAVRWRDLNDGRTCRQGEFGLRIAASGGRGGRSAHVFLGPDVAEAVKGRMEKEADSGRVGHGGGSELRQ